MTEARLKRAEYPNFGKGMGQVAYVRIGASGNQIIFSGVTDKTTSTVNAAERIIQSISLAEQIEDPKRIVWCDLQTQRGYSYFRPGEYEFNHLVLHGNAPDIEVVQWIRAEPSQYILDLFTAEIGPNPRTRQL
jgi:hypothetical protein